MLVLLPYDIVDLIVKKCVDQGFLYYSLISSCKAMYVFGKHRKDVIRGIAHTSSLFINLSLCHLYDFKHTAHWSISDALDAIDNDDIERIALIIHECDNASDCIKLALLCESIKVSWWLWYQHRPYLTVQILMEIERRMLMNQAFRCSELTFRVMKIIQCAHEAAAIRNEQ